jgi:hypothetical protein
VPNYSQEHNCFNSCIFVASKACNSTDAEFLEEDMSVAGILSIAINKQNSDQQDMQAVNERRRKYCATCGLEITV